MCEAYRTHSGHFRGGVIFAFLAVEWDPREINQWKFVTHIHVRVALQTGVSMKVSMLLTSVSITIILHNLTKVSVASTSGIN